jgi:hypothetical protein
MLIESDPVEQGSKCRVREAIKVYLELIHCRAEVSFMTIPIGACKFFTHGLDQKNLMSRLGPLGLTLSTK